MSDRSLGVRHVDLGHEVRVFQPGPPEPTDILELTPALPITPDPAGCPAVSDAWRSVVDAQAELLAGLEARCLEGEAMESLLVDGAAVLASVEQMNGVVLEDEPAMAAYAHARLHPYWLQSPFVARAFFKPRGYAGDFLLMHWMYEGDCRAPSRLGELLSRFYLQLPVVQAGVSRIAWLVEHLRAEIDARTGPLHIGSLACGPAAELERLLSTLERPVAVSLLDQDSAALNFCAHRFLPLQDGSKVGGPEVRLLNVPVKQILAAPEVVGEVVGQLDILWAVGLFDYLPDNVARRLVARLRDLLKPGGKLIVGNFAPHSGSRFMELIGDWRLIYRTPQQLAALADGVVSSEPNGLMWFLQVDAAT